MKTIRYNDNFSMKCLNTEKLVTMAGGISAMVTARNVAGYQMVVEYLTGKVDSAAAGVDKLSATEANDVNNAALLLKCEELATLQDDLAEASDVVARGIDVYNAVLDNVEAAGGDREIAARLLRIAALDGNKYLTPFAFDGDDFKDSIMTALAALTTGMKYDGDGVPVITADTMKQCGALVRHVRTLIKNNFTLKHGGDYFKRVDVKPTAEEIQLIVRSFVRDFDVVRVSDDDGGRVDYDVKTRDWRGVRAQIVKLVLAQLMNA